MPVALRSAKSCECSCVRLALFPLWATQTLSSPIIRIFIIYTNAPPSRMLSVGKLRGPKRAPRRRSCVSSTCNNSFVKVCARHTLSAWIECWLWASGIGIFHPVLSTAGLLSHRPAATAPLRKVIAAAMVLFFHFNGFAQARELPWLFLWLHESPFCFYF